MASAQPAMEPSLCRSCGECVRNCPAKAIDLVKGVARIDESKCIACYCCDEVCPHGAVYTKRTPFCNLVAGIACVFGTNLLG